MMQMITSFSCLIALLLCIGCQKEETKESPPAVAAPEAEHLTLPLSKNAAVFSMIQFQLPRIGLDTGSKLRIGDAFPELSCVDLDGNEIAFGRNALGERYTLVVFWSTWCGACMQELPHEIELGDRYADVGLRIVGINADATREEGKAAAVKNKVPWLNLYEGKEHSISDQLGISSWPCLFLLDSKGTIVASNEMRRTTILEMSDGSVQQKSYLDWTLESLFASVKQTIDK